LLCWRYSDGIAGGQAKSDAKGAGGGEATAGFLPMGMTPSTMNGGRTNFLGVGTGFSDNVGSGYFGNFDASSFVMGSIPIVTNFKAPNFDAVTAGLFANP
jgi:hypothetical protein